MPVIRPNISGNAGTATKLLTARTIGGVTFDGTANINLPGVNTAGNQDTSGNAATATTAAACTGNAATATNVDWTGVLNKPPIQSMDLLGTLATTTGTTVTLSGLDLSIYRQIVIVIDDVSTSNTSATLKLNGTTGPTFAQLPAAGDVSRGMVYLDLASGTFFSAAAPNTATANSFATGTVYGGNHPYTTASTSITLATGGSIFDAGAFQIYGVK